MMRCNTHQGVLSILSPSLVVRTNNENSNTTALSRCPKITEDVLFSLFLGGHTHNKTLSCRTTEGWEDSGNYLAK